MSITDITVDELWDKEHDLYLLINPISIVKRILKQKVFLLSEPPFYFYVY